MQSGNTIRGKQTQINVLTHILGQRLGVKEGLAVDGKR